MFADYFKSVYSNVSPAYLSPVSVNIINPSLNIPDITITQLVVETHLKNLDLTKGCGPDNLAPYFLCHTVETISILFNKSLCEGTFPDYWKTARVLPVFKSGDRCLVSNYRPIAILNVIAKVFEKIIYNVLFDHTSHLITYKQHGFTKSRSTLTNLLNFSEYVYEALSLGYGTDVIYTDLAKAFDKVNHNILLSKLSTFGIGLDIVKWLNSYLRNRCHFVEINGSKSAMFIPTSRVPQGSILGPLLFLYFINDIVRGIESEILLFADDLKLYRSIRTLSDCMALQMDLNKIVNWCAANGMELNINKCCVLRIKRRQFVYYSQPYSHYSTIGKRSWCCN